LLLELYVSVAWVTAFTVNVTLPFWARRFDLVTLQVPAVPVVQDPVPDAAPVQEPVTVALATAASDAL
jgi:hypothetical protein